MKKIMVRGLSVAMFLAIAGQVLAANAGAAGTVTPVPGKARPGARETAIATAKARAPQMAKQIKKNKEAYAKKKAKGKPGKVKTPVQGK